MRTRPEYRRSFSAIGAVSLTAVFAHLAGTAQTASASPPFDPYLSYRSRTSVSLGVKALDFTSSQPDFAGVNAPGGKGRYAKIPADALAPDGKPVFSSTGYKVASDWKDSAGNAIIPTRSYINTASGDAAGSMSTTPGGAVTSATTFNQWFRPTAGVNTQYQSSMTLNWTGTNYVFDGSLDTFSDHADFDYTAAIDTTFIHDASRNYYIDVATGAEAFVYIDGKLVIDGGGGMASDALDPGLPGGHFDVDIYNADSSHQQYHKHQYDDTYNVAYVDIVNDSRLLFATDIGTNTHPLRIQFMNVDNAGWGIFSYADTTTKVENWVSAGFDHVVVASNLKQLRIDFRTLALMAHTSPGTSHADVANRAGAFNVRITDTVTGKLVYELATYHHGTAPADYQQVRDDYNAHKNDSLDGGGMPPMTQRIDLSRLALDNGTTHSLKVFFANRTGASHFHFDTNIDTLDLVAVPCLVQDD